MREKRAFSRKAPISIYAPRHSSKKAHPRTIATGGMERRSAREGSFLSLHEDSAFIGDLGAGEVLVRLERLTIVWKGAETLWSQVHCMVLRHVRVGETGSVPTILIPLWAIRSSPQREWSQTPAQVAVEAARPRRSKGRLKTRHKGCPAHERPTAPAHPATPPVSPLS